MKKHQLVSAMQSIEAMTDHVADEKADEFNDLIHQAARQLDEGKFEECRWTLFDAHELIAWTERRNEGRM